MPIVFPAKVSEGLVGGALVPGGWLKTSTGQAAKMRILTPWSADGCSLSGMSMIDTMMWWQEVTTLLSMRVEHGHRDTVILEGRVAHQFVAAFPSDELRATNLLPTDLGFPVGTPYLYCMNIPAAMGLVELHYSIYEGLPAP